MAELRSLILALVEKGIDVIDAAEIIASAAIEGARDARRDSAAEKRREYDRNRKRFRGIPVETVTENPKEVESISTGIPPDSGGNDNHTIDIKKEEEEEERKTIVRNRRQYPVEFQDFWRAYPTDVGMSKAEALKIWCKLTADEQAQATAAVPAFKAWVAKQGDNYRTLHACRYLSQKRFEGFADAAKTEEVNGASQFYVRYGTDAGDAWERHYKGHGKIAPRDSRGGWYFATEFPS